MSILLRFPKRNDLINHLEEVKQRGQVTVSGSILSGEDAIVKYERSLWQEWGRAMRPMRFATVFQMILAKVEHHRMTSYGNLAASIDLGSHNELGHIINYVGKFCVKNGWPPYTVVVKNQETEKVGAGFFKFHDPAGTKYPNEIEKDQFEKDCEQRCFTTRVPDQVTVLCRLIEYITHELPSSGSKQGMNAEASNGN